MISKESQDEKKSGRLVAATGAQKISHASDSAFKADKADC